MMKLKLNTKTQKLTYMGLMSAVAIVLGYVEFLIPFNFGIPGIKLGLSNIVILMMLETSNFKMSTTVAALKIAISSLLFGNIFSFWYTLAGGALSLIVMALFRKSDKFSIVGVSIAGGVFHNIGQIAVAVILMSEIKIAYYLPVLLISGAITGALIGITLKLLLSKLFKLK